MSELQVNSSYTMTFSDDGSLVYFIADIRELFNVPTSYPGIKTIIKTAFNHSKQYIPFKTGLLRRSYTLEYFGSDLVKIYFDPSKIVGSSRNGRTVESYYAKYLKEKEKTFNWLMIIMKHFYDILIKEVRKLKEKEKNITILSLTFAIMFLDSFNKQYNNKKEEYKLQQRRVA